jgi:hypothetical protein
MSCFIHGKLSRVTVQLVVPCLTGLWFVQIDYTEFNVLFGGSTYSIAGYIF